MSNIGNKTDFKMMVIVKSKQEDGGQRVEAACRRANI